ncbi:MAG: hypothetical protein NUV93_01400 [Firmicutes bacterium]|jgi:hypothetical protein|nr:hypothetical protein [Bacillota bacterium]
MADRRRKRIPRRCPNTLVDIDNPDDADLLDEGPEDNELPDIEVPEIQAPDDGDYVLENSRRRRLFKNM